MTEKKHNVFTKSLLTVACATLISAAPVASADPLADIADAFKNGTTKVSFRLRYETVDQDNARSDAEALTLKSRITFKTADYKGFGLLVEADDVTNLGIDQADVHPGPPGDNTFSVIADDEYTEINQVYLSYAGIPDTTVKFGRQRILLDNQRFVGGSPRRCPLFWGSTDIISLISKPEHSQKCISRAYRDCRSHRRNA